MEKKKKKKTQSIDPNQSKLIFYVPLVAVRFGGNGGELGSHIPLAVPSVSVINYNYEKLFK